jgi:surface antigen
MENMRSLAVITVLISLVLAQANAEVYKRPPETQGTVGSMPYPTTIFGNDVKYSLFLHGFRHTQYLRFRLRKDEKQLHESAVFFMLKNAPNGKIVSWYSKERLASGKVRVIQSYPRSSGYCRIYQAYIKINGKERHMTNIACKKDRAVSWSFYK